MAKKIPTVAIIGRTNVGKSTLFNALAGRALSIVEDSPGVTRDRHYTLVTRYGFSFTLIDTGGLAGEQETKLQESVRTQTIIAIEESDLIVAIFDGMSGLHPMDEEVVRTLRNAEKPVLWVVNKCESPHTEIEATELYALGVDSLIFVSAAHRKGIKELAEAIRIALGIPKPVEADEKEQDTRAPDEPLKVALIGKPNVGKSSLINKILGEERVVASEIPGTTRDSIDITLKREGSEFVIVDTAGLRKKARVDDATVERYSNLRTLRSLVECDVAVLVLDATLGAPTEQDAKIAGLVHERGRPFVIVVNKWDAVEKDHLTVKSYEDAVYEAFKFARYAPIVFASAVTGQRCPNILRKAKEVFDTSRLRIQTADLNRILSNAFYRKPPPAYRSEPIKLFFATQVGVSPPKIVLFLNHPRKIAFSYERYLKNTLRKEYPFEGSDIKFQIRKRTEKADRNRDGQLEERE